MRDLAFLKTAAAGVFALSCALAGAQTPSDLNRVEVTGQAPGPITRHDVHAACPNIDAELQASVGLLAARAHTRTVGDMRVDFTLSGSTVSAVHAHGSSIDMMQGVKRAVRHVGCANAGQSQHYAFLLSMREASDEEVAAGAPPVLAAISTAINPANSAAISPNVNLNVIPNINPAITPAPRD